MAVENKGHHWPIVGISMFFSTHKDPVNYSVLSQYMDSGQRSGKRTCLTDHFYVRTLPVVFRSPRCRFQHETQPSITRLQASKNTSETRKDSLGKNKISLPNSLLLQTTTLFNKYLLNI